MSDSNPDVAQPPKADILADAFDAFSAVLRPICILLEANAAPGARLGPAAELTAFLDGQRL
jgi:hypothetical protein